MEHGHKVAGGDRLGTTIVDRVEPGLSQ